MVSVFKLPGYLFDLTIGYGCYVTYSLSKEPMESLDHEERKERLLGIATTISNLLETRDLDEQLGELTRLIASSLRAMRCLIVVQHEIESRVLIHQVGFDPVKAKEAADLLIQNGETDVSKEETSIIVSISSADCSYGKIAVIGLGNPGFDADDQEFLNLCANVVSTYLELEEKSVEETSRTPNTKLSKALLKTLLDRLLNTKTVYETSYVLANFAPTLIPCDSSTVLIWDQLSKKLIIEMVSNITPDNDDPSVILAQQQTSKRPSTQVRGEKVVFIPEEEVDLLGDDQPGDVGHEISPIILTPLLDRLQSSPGVLLFERNSVDPAQLAAMRRHKILNSHVCPITLGNKFLGAITADYVEQRSFEPNDNFESKDNVDIERLLTLLSLHGAIFLERSILYEEISNLMHHDHLTALANKELFDIKVVQALDQLRRFAKSSSVFLVNIDQFEDINKVYGYALGNQLVKEVANRLSKIVRRHDTVARVGPDEFAVLLFGLSDSKAMDSLANRMIDSLKAPYRIDEIEFQASATIGIALLVDHGPSGPSGPSKSDEILRNASSALRDAKKLGNGSRQVFQD